MTAFRFIIYLLLYILMKQSNIYYYVLIRYNCAMISQLQPLQNFHPSQNPQLQSWKIKTLLKSSFQTLAKLSPTNLEISMAHQQIADAMKNQHFFDTITSLLLQLQHSLQPENLVKQILTTITTYLRQQQSKNSMAKRTDCANINNKLIRLFLDDKFREKYRSMLLKSYTQFIYAPRMENIRNQTVQNLCKGFVTLSSDLPNQLQKQSFLEDKVFGDLALHVSLAHSLLKGPIEQNLMKNILKTFLFPVLSTTNLLINTIEMSIISENQPLFIQISFWGERFMQFLKLMITATSKDYLGPIRTELLNNPLLLAVLKTSLTLGIQQRQKQQLIEVVVKSNGNSYLQRINDIKKNAIDIIQTLAKLTLKAQQSQQQISKKQYQIPCKVIKYVLETVTPIFIHQFQLLEYPKNDLPHKGISMTLMKTLAVMVKIYKFYHQSQKLRNQIIFNLCLPLLQTPESLKLTSAQNFKDMRQDILSTHATGIPQNAACVLIQAYLDKVDGSVSHFSQQIANIIYFHLSGNTNYYEVLPAQLIQTYFFKNVDCIRQIQCGLMALALLSYVAVGRQDIVQLVQTLMISKKQFFFASQNPGNFKSAVLLCYSYYVDNFYLNLAKKKTFTHPFHLQILEECCVYIRQYTGIKQKSLYSQQQLMMLQIGALQALDCLSNCLTQRHFLALFQSHNNPILLKANEQIFINIFRFLVSQLKYELNIKVVTILIQFYTEAIKNQCKKDFKLKTFHYQVKNAPSIIRNQLSAYLCPQLYKLHNLEYIPNKKLIHTKIMNLLQLIVTCCQNPHQYINSQFFSLQTEVENIWDRVEIVDVYLRRAVTLKKEGSIAQYSILQSILGYCRTLTNDVVQTGEIKQLFGVFVNLMIVNEEIIDLMIAPLSSLLAQLLEMEEEASQYMEQLQESLQKCSYILMVAIHLRITEGNSSLWRSLVELIFNNLLRKSSQGFLIFTNSSRYIGKLLAFCLVFIYKVKGGLDEVKTSYIWRNVIKMEDAYKSTTEKLIVSLTITKLLGQMQTISQSDIQCQTCFKMLCNLLHSIYKNPLQKQLSQQSKNQDSFAESESSETEQEKEGVRYKQYSVCCNEYVLQDQKQIYILAFKDLCHKLKQSSPGFLKICLDSLILQISRFIKQKVFYFEGNLNDNGMRKVIKVKK